jgi:phosphoglycerate dehydrogenase-like enzyme
MTEKIVYLLREDHTPVEIIENFKRHLPDGFSLTFSSDTDSDEKRQGLISDADYIIVYGRSFDDFDVAKKAKIFQVLSAGFDRLDLDAFNKAGIPVCNNGGANAPTVAENVILFSLMLYHKVLLHHNGLQNGEWIGHVNAMSMYELRGKQIGIIGLGNIGRQVAGIAKGFQCPVVVHDVVDVPDALKKELSVQQVPLDELLATSDVVTAHVPLDASTRGMMNKDVFKKMKNSALYIAASRGPVTVEADLIAALDQGEIAGAGVDVFEDEPTATDNPLFGRENVIVTPHNAGTSVDTWTRRMEFAFANIQRVSKGEKPLAVVNGL